MLSNKQLQTGEHNDQLSYCLSNFIYAQWGLKLTGVTYPKTSPPSKFLPVSLQKVLWLLITSIAVIEVDTSPLFITFKLIISVLCKENKGLQCKIQGLTNKTIII